ncbi:uncharacterized protein LOC141629639 [Silene latifolia]|uniref:uncharacterized protein LOC141629639 n=1 Tax=Silene latifolia TaxID=37657 RepID=UPI003D771D54
MYDGLILKIQSIATKFSTKHLSYAGRIQVLNSVVFGLTNFWCTSLLMPRQICKRINRISKSIFWGHAFNDRKPVFKSLTSICTPWEEGGFNIKSLQAWNTAALLQWLWKIDQNQGAIWTKWIDNYITNSTSIWDVVAHEKHSESIRGILQIWDSCIQNMGGFHSFQLLLRSFTVRDKFSIRKAYAHIRNCGSPQPVYNAIHHGTMVSRHKVLLMLAVQDRLATVAKLMSRGLPMANRCSLCKQATETSTPLFFSCNYTGELQHCVKQWTNIHFSSTELSSLLLWKRIS